MRLGASVPRSTSRYQRSSHSPESGDDEGIRPQDFGGAARAEVLPPAPRFGLEVDELILEGTYTNGALAAVVTKVLHRKRRSLVPLLDQYIAKAYVGDKGWGILADSGAKRQRYQIVLGEAISGIQNDLRSCHNELDALAQRCTRQGWLVSDLRVHDILVWTETEPSGYYRG